MKNYLIIVFIFLAHSLSAYDLYDFEDTYDSLARRLPRATGIERINILHHMVTLLAPWEPEQCRPMAEEALTLSEDLKYDEGIGLSYQALGDIEFYSDNYIKALDHFYDAVDKLEKTALYKELGRSYEKIATIFLNTGNAKKAEEYIPIIIEVLKKGENLDELAAVYLALGFFHNNHSGDYAASIKIHKLALSLARKENMPSRYLGSIAGALSYAFILNGQADSAIHYRHKSFAFFNDNLIPDRIIKTEGLYDYGYLLGEYFNSDSSLFYMKEGLKSSRDLSFNFGIFMSANYIANYFYGLGENDKAIEYYKLAEENALKVNATGFAFSDERYKRAPVRVWDVHIRSMTPSSLKVTTRKTLVSIYVQISRAMEKKGKQGKALEYHKQYFAYADTLNRIANDKQLLGLEIGFETERHLQQISFLEQQTELQRYQIQQNNIFLFGLGALVLLIALFAILFIRQNRIKAKQEAFQFKQRLFRSQLNPHFIFNALSTIQNSIVNEEPEKASKYLARFSKLVRNILDSTADELIPLAEEINTMESYLALQKIRFPEKIDYHIDIDPGIDIDVVTIPPLLAQPFIENAIVHGIRPKKEKGRIEIRLRRLNDCTILEVEDNGVGREKARQILMKKDPNHKSMATEITRGRIQAFNRHSKKKMAMSIIDLKDENGQANGTLVRFEVPITS